MMHISRNTYLLINNDPLDHAVFTWALSDVDPSSICCVASSEDAAMALMIRGGIIPDLIFVDYDLPYLNVRRFIKKLKLLKRYQRIPVILHCKERRPSPDHCLRDIGAFAVHYKEYSYEGVKSMLQFYFLPGLMPIFLN